MSNPRIGIKVIGSVKKSDNSYDVTFENGKVLNTNSTEYTNLYNSGILYTENNDATINITPNATNELVEFSQLIKELPFSKNIGSYFSGVSGKIARANGQRPDDFTTLPASYKQEYDQLIDREFSKRFFDKNNVSEGLNSGRGVLLDNAMKDLNPEQQQALLNNLPSNLKPSIWSDVQDGVRRLSSFNRGYQNTVDNDPYYSNQEKNTMVNEVNSNPITSRVKAPLDVLSGLSVFPKAVQALYRDNYTMQDAIGGVKNDANILEDMVTDPLNIALGGLSVAQKARMSKYAGVVRDLGYEEAINNFASGNNLSKRFKSADNAINIFDDVETGLRHKAFLESDNTNEVRKAFLNNQQPTNKSVNLETYLNSTNEERAEILNRIKLFNSEDNVGGVLDYSNNKINNFFSDPRNKVRANEFFDKLRANPSKEVPNEFIDDFQKGYFENIDNNVHSAFFPSKQNYLSADRELVNNSSSIEGTSYNLKKGTDYRVDTGTPRLVNDTQNFVFPRKSFVESEGSIAQHEVNHSMYSKDDFKLLQHPYFKDLINSTTDYKNLDVREVDFVKNNPEFLKLPESEINEFNSYLNTPEERLARLSEIRYKLNIPVGVDVTPEQVEKGLDALRGNKNSDYALPFYNAKTVANFFNSTPAVLSAVAIPAWLSSQKSDGKTP